MEITRREIIFSSIIVGIMLIIGIAISDKISDRVSDRNEIYNKAIRIESKDIFEYGMRTNVGNSFIYGDLVAVDPVGYPEIDGDYLYIKKIKERYTQHTRTVTYSCGKDNKQTCTKTETYWTWDRVGLEEKRSEKIKLLDVELDFDKFNLPSDDYLTTIRESSHVRYKYYAVPKKVTGTIFTDLRDGDIGDNVSIIENMTIEEAYNYLTMGKMGLFIFWFFWILLTGGSVCGFCYLENKWLY